jgi:flagellar motility protein MotE (MotC chaperone)
MRLGAGTALARPRLLPVTIAAMLALLAVKSVSLMRAAAEEVGGKPSLAPAEVAAVPRSAPAAAPADMPAPQPELAADPPVSAAERSVLLDLRKRRDQLEARARAQDARDAELQAADRRLGDRIQQLAALQAKLEALEAGRQLHRAENWSGLVKIYETMKPRDAAAIFDALDMQVLLQVLDRMQERRVAPILAAMQPDRARLATQLLAEMRMREVNPAAPPAGAPPAPDPNPVLPKG